jgi:hypothetical protein
MFRRDFAIGPKDKFRTPPHLAKRPDQREHMAKSGEQYTTVPVIAWENDDTRIPVRRKAAIAHKIVIVREQDSVVALRECQYILVVSALKADCANVFRVPSRASQ